MRKFEMQFSLHNKLINDTVDFTNSLEIENNIFYDLNGAYGNFGRMMIYATVEVYDVDINYYQRIFYIKVHSFYWKKHKLYNGQCCSINTFEPCVVSCHYFIQLFLSRELLLSSALIPSTKFKTNNVYVYAVATDSFPNSKYNILIVLKDAELEEIIDIANINGEKYSATEAIHGIKIKGIYDNVDLTVSFG
ncbi:hypothetical protein HZS_7764 [Henneguya salminicola]|nr:hypothetical protein HZS_7764 [Henneguya salminicola]